MARFEILEQMEHAHLFLQAATSGLRNDRLETVKLGPEWTVREIMAHLVGWEKEFHQEARALARRNHCAFDYRIDPSDDWRAFNAEQVESRRGMSTGEIFLETEREQSAFIEWVRGLPERKLAHETTYPWGSRGTLEHLLQTVVGHKLAHARRIREWRIEHP